MNHAWLPSTATTGAAEIEQQTLSGLNARYASLKAQIVYHRSRNETATVDYLAQELKKVEARRKAWFGQ